MENKELIQMFSSLLDEKLQPLNQRLERLEDGQQRLEGRQQKLEEGQQRLEGRQQKLEEGQQRLEGRQLKLEDGQKVIIEKINNMSERVAINTEKQLSVESVAIKVAEQDKDIKLLKKLTKIK